MLQDGVAELARLEELLAKQDMEAAAAFESLRPWLLQQGMQAASCQQLQRLIDDLDFSPALAELQAWMALQGKAND